jgi:hypothetical protein
MKLKTSFDFVRAEVDKKKLIISSEIPLEVLSSAVLNGGFRTADKIAGIHVPEENEENVHRNSEALDKELLENPDDIFKSARVVPLILAGLTLDDDIKVGLTPKDMFDQPTAINSFQNSIINHIRGKNETKNLKVDEASLTVVENLGPFTRGILAMMMDNAYRKLCDKS